jgi:hypothetical protein
MSRYESVLCDRRVSHSQVETLRFAQRDMLQENEYYEACMNTNHSHFNHDF